MLPISTMAVAAVLGSACGTNMATMNDYNAGLYNGSNNPQNVCYQHGNQDLDCILSQMGVSAPSGLPMITTASPAWECSDTMR